jgi:alanine-glyoxylate transaminase / serine-glyoxylate transaminase / serine-pyruvate transaminase
MTTFVPGYHFVQAPGPTNVPGRVLRAMSAPTIDHRGPEFTELTTSVLAGMREVLRTDQPVVIFPSSGTGAWEASLVNTLSPRAHIVAFDRGHFARTWAEVARRLGFEVDLVPGDWRRPASASELEQLLMKDSTHSVRAVLIVHNETSTGVVADIPAFRAALDRADHPALLLVDTISSLGSLDYRHDEWGVDVAVGCSQKGLLLPPGLSFNALSTRALAAARCAETPRSYWDWFPVLKANERGQFPYTPPTNLLFGLNEALAMLREEGLDAVFARHQRHALATRCAVSSWGLETVCQDPAGHSAVLTGVMAPAGADERTIRQIVLDHFGVALGSGLGDLEGKAFRIGHLGDFNDAMLIGTLGAIELGLRAATGRSAGPGVAAALDSLSSDASTE